jgi:hypothetical protein
MQINLGETSIIQILPSLSEQEIQNRISDQRMDAFGIGARLMQRPRPSEILIAKSQKRYEPFWYGVAHAVYRYDRHSTQHVPVAPEVASVTLFEQEVPVKGERIRAFSVDVVEHCVDDFRRYLMLDAETGEERDYSRYMNFKTAPVEDLEALQADDALVIYPEIKSSFVAGKLVQSSIKTVQADKIEEERIDLEYLVLYYRPVYAYEYHWTTKDKRVVVEFDPLMNIFRTEGGQFKQQLRKVLANDTLFDIGADAIGTVVPGANLAVKLGRLAARKVVD